MKNRIFVGCIIIAAGILISLTPVVIFPVCSNFIRTMGGGGGVPMKCFWSGRAEIGVGILISMGGLFLLLCAPVSARIGISLMLALTAIFSIAIPTVLIGGCEMPSMPCRIATFPALILLGVFVCGVSLGNAFYLWKRGGGLKHP
jgi:hypothetical protein